MAGTSVVLGVECSVGIDATMLKRANQPPHQLSTYSTSLIYKYDGIGMTDAPKYISILMRDCRDVLRVSLFVLDLTFVHATLASGTQCHVLQGCC
jgi:hypothetical protein